MWWANFKLLAFCCGRGPLCENRSPTLLAFASVLLLPMSPVDSAAKEKKKRRRSVDAEEAGEKGSGPKSQFVTYASKGALKVIGLAICVWILKHLSETEQYGNGTKNFFFSFALYYLLGVFEDLLGSVSANLIGIEVERSFNKPFLSSSLKEFWTLRWNQHVAKLLKVVVYAPIVEGSLIHTHSDVKGLKSKKGRSNKSQRPMPLHIRILGTMGTFLMSGIMHEIVFMFISDSFTLSWLLYFTLQGVYVLMEGILVHLLLARLGIKSLPKWLTIPLTISFLLVSAEWHFFKPLRVHGIDTAGKSNGQ